MDIVDHYDALDDRPEWLKAVPAATEPREKYYLFLHVLVRRYSELRRCLEIGTRQGTGALHLAHGLRDVPGSDVVTVDIEPGCKTLVEGIAAANGLKNLRAVTGDSNTVKVDGTFDLLFIDGFHDLVSSYGDYLRFRPQVRDGGLIVFDDTRLNPGMTVAWNSIVDPKVELPELHYMGFGVAMKWSAGPPPLSTDEVRRRA